MKLGYKYYRNNLIKLAILSVACLGIFWDHLRGKGNPKDELGALILIAVLMLAGNIGLFIAMRRAKRREDSRAPQGKPVPAIESRLVLEDRDLYTRIRDASAGQRVRVAAAVARWAVTTVHLTNPALALAFSQLAPDKAASPAATSAVERLASDLDGEYLRLQERKDEGGEVSETQVLAAFSRARAADAVRYALAGEAAEAVYEAIKATDQLPAVRAVVLSALS